MNNFIEFSSISLVKMYNHNLAQRL